MMMGPGETRRLELWMTYVRWLGFAFAAVAVSIQPALDPAVERSAWSLVVFLGLGNLTIWGSLERMKSERDLTVFGGVIFAFDAGIVLALAWVLAGNDPYVMWALLLVLPMEGALRYRLFGALAVAAGNAAFFVFQTHHVAALTGSGFDHAMYVFVVGLGTLVAMIAGVMAENWHRQQRRFHDQGMRLAEVDRLKDRFLAVTSHEIRGPLTAIIAGVDTVQKRGDRLSSEQKARMLDMVSQQGHQLARLVDDLLLTGQLQERQLALHPEWTDLPKIIEESTDAAGGKRRSHQLEIFVDPIKCFIDHARVSQIVRNLVENAYKYTPERTRVAVTATGGSAGIVLEITDDGPGIPADRRDQLFEAFHRIKETAAGQDGVGLGLYVVSQLVAAMGGHIDLASSSTGTTFTIHIPCRTITLEERHLTRVDSGPHNEAV